MSTYLIIFIIYFIAIAIVSIFFVTYQKVKKPIIAIISSSATSILLLPLFLNSVGNPILKDFFSGKYTGSHIFELLAFATVASLASNSLINIILGSFNLKNIEKDLEKTKDSLEEYEEEQDRLITRQVASDLNEDRFKKQRNKYHDFLTSIKQTAENNPKCFEKDDENMSIIEELKGIGYIKIHESIDDKYLHCKLTKIGEEFLNMS